MYLIFSSSEPPIHNKIVGKDHSIAEHRWASIFLLVLIKPPLHLDDSYKHNVAFIGVNRLKVSMCFLHSQSSLAWIAHANLVTKQTNLKSFEHADHQVSRSYRIYTPRFESSRALMIQYKQLQPLLLEEAFDKFITVLLLSTVFLGFVLSLLPQYGHYTPFHFL